jgi:hypothetical protein
MTSVRLWLVYGLFMTILAALCFGSLRHHLLNTHDADSFADHSLIDQNPSLFFSPEKNQATGRLVADGTKYIVYGLYGNNPAAFHLAVVATHLVAALLLAGLVWQLSASNLLAALSGLLFLLNVAHFEAIHHISALDYPLGLACACAAWLCWKQSAPWRVPAFALLMVCAIQAHPSLAALWIMPLYDIWKTRNRDNHLYYLAVTALPIAAAVVASVLLASHKTSTWLAIEMYSEQSLSSLLAGQIHVLLLLSSRLLSTAHWVTTPIYSTASWEWGLGLAIVALLLYLLYRRQAPYDWASLWVLAGLLPYILMTESTIEGLPAGPSRYLYIASAGSSILLATALQWIIRKQRYVGWALTVGIVFSSYVFLRKVEAISLYTSARLSLRAGI